MNQRNDTVLTAAATLEMQREQFRHDQRNHSDILSLHKNERLKHYGLHFCKYVGRLARGNSEEKSVSRTITDIILVSLSAANTLHQQLGAVDTQASASSYQNDLHRHFADAAGRFADACEKIDHLEEFMPQATKANSDIFRWAINYCMLAKIDYTFELTKRKRQLAERPFFIQD